MDDFHTPPPTPEVLAGNELVTRVIELKEQKIALNKEVKKLKTKNKKLEEDNARLLEAIKNISSIGKDILNDCSDSTDIAMERDCELGMKSMANDGVQHITRDEEDNNNNMDNVINQEDEMGGGIDFLVNSELNQMGELNFMANDRGELIQMNFLPHNNDYQSVLAESSSCYCSGSGNDSCGRFCPKVLSCGYHCCQQLCHYGDCGVCQTCRVCGKGFKCGKHRCEQLNCQNPDHTCNLTCDNLLSCGQHTCGQTCHWGECSSCTLCSGYRIDPVDCPTDHQFVCHVCKKTFKSKSALNIHKSHHRKNTEMEKNKNNENITENIPNKMPPVSDPDFLQKFQNFFANMTKSKDSKRNLLTKLKNEAFIEIIKSNCSCDVTVTMK